MSQLSLGLDSEEACETRVLDPGVAWLRGFARARAVELLADIATLASKNPFRTMTTPGGLRMSVAMTNCGSFGWVTDRAGYRYDRLDPETSAEWPAMSRSFVELARDAATEAGFPGFAPDACLVNRYAPGTRLSLHQDKDEIDFAAPIVSVSLGLPATFLFGGATRAERPRRIPLSHGDVIVWGGPARLRYHGVLPIEDGNHPLTGSHRFNLTFRKAR